MICILILCAFCIPKNDILTIDSTTRALGISIFSIIFLGVQLLKQDSKVNIYSVDIWWCLLIVYTGLSSLWATNSGYAIYGMFTTIILYGCFRVFNSIDWLSDLNNKIFYWLIFTCIIVGLLIEFFAVKDAILNGLLHKVDKDIPALFGKNLHMLGSLLVILFPYILFSNNKSSRIISPILIVLSLPLVYRSGSAQVSILLILICVIYILYRLPYIRRLKYITLLFFLGIISIALYKSTYSTKRSISSSYILKEFKQQNDRKLMWQRSILLFKESPIFGIGKNNWEIEYGKYGYDDFQHFNGNINSANRYKHPHNSIFSILSEQGLLGILIYIYISVIPLLRVFNERQLLSKLEIAATASLVLFFLLSLIYGTVYNFYNNFAGLNTIAVIGLAIINKKANQSTVLFEAKNKTLLIFVMAGLLVSVFYFNEMRLSKKSYKIAAKANRANKMDKAAKSINRSTKYLAEIGSLLQKGNIFYKIGENDKALGTHLKAANLDPYNPLVIYSLANHQFRIKDFSSAISTAEKSINIDKDYIPSELVYVKAKFNQNPIEENMKEIIALKNKLEGLAKLNHTLANRNGYFYQKYDSRYKYCLRTIEELNRFAKIKKRE